MLALPAANVRSQFAKCACQYFPGVPLNIKRVNAVVMILLILEKQEFPPGIISDVMPSMKRQFIFFKGVCF